MKPALLGILGLVSMSLAFACAGGPKTAPRIPNSLDAFLVWTDADVESTTAADGTRVDAIAVRSGDIVRLEAPDDAPLEIAERSASRGSLAEVWETVKPTNHAAFVRVGALTNALLVPHDKVSRVLLGHGSDPGYYWFSLEDRVIEWADGPLGVEFPEVAPDRVDVDGFRELDGALSEAIANARDRSRATLAARSIRRIASLRAIRALRPASGFPYFFDSVPELPRGTERGKVGRREGYRVAPGKPLLVPVDGPALLHLWVVPEDPTHESTFDVFEGDIRRASATSTPPRMPSTHYDRAGSEAEPTRGLRRAVVHVPPGHHVYRLEAAAPVAVSPMRAEAVVHLEDASTKSERVLLTRAREACAGGLSPPLCAFALSLAGEEQSANSAVTRSLSFAAAMGGSSDRARRVANMLSAGGPKDPLPEIERRAATGSGSDLAQLGSAIGTSVDDAVRAAWGRAVLAGSEWIVSVSDHEPETWFEPTIREAQQCATSPQSSLLVTKEGLSVSAVSWHGAPAVELVVVAPCDEASAVELVVDGERIVGNPAGPNVRWHVRVNGPTALVRRVDAGRASVYAVHAKSGVCSADMRAIRAPQGAGTSPSLKFTSTKATPGLEIWRRGSVTTVSLAIAEPSGLHRARIAIRPSAGPIAFDPSGVSWTRVARVALPSWAAAGIVVNGDSDTAVRPLERVPIGSVSTTKTESRVPPATAIDDGALVEASRKILGAPLGGRGKAYLDRALLLAEAGAGEAAAADAAIAEKLGEARAKERVSAAARAREHAVAPLPDGVKAYGVEPDFDPAAARCQPPPDGPRARLQAARDLLSARSLEQGRRYDAAEAVKALRAAEESPLDPRSDALVRRALAGSRWRLRTDLPTPGERVRRERPQQHEGPLDADGTLRPRVAAGAPFETGTFASIFPKRPAEAVVARWPLDVTARVDVGCVGTNAEALSESCPLEVRLGDEPSIRPTVGPDGRASVVLPRISNRAKARLTISLGENETGWVALARISFDHSVPGTRQVDATSWVLLPRHLETRYLLRADEELPIAAAVGGVFRIDALAEGDSATAASVRTAGLPSRDVPTDGSPVVVALLPGETATVRAGAGPVSIAIAERVANDAAGAGPNRSAPQSPPQEPSYASAAASQLVVLDLSRDGSRFYRIAAESPRPLTKLEASFGTLFVTVGGVYGTLRPGFPSSPNPESFGFGILGYRRRIESIGLWTLFDVFARVRAGEPTRGASAGLYEEIEAIHLRISGAVSGEEQIAAGLPASVWTTNEFVEYSYRATKDFFVLPRLGVDGVYMSLRTRPTSLVAVDHEIYNPYRKVHPTFAFAQALLWYTPYFDDVFYLRLRGSSDPRVAVLGHATARPGVFIALGQLDVSAFAETAWFSASESATQSAHLSESLGAVFRYNSWSGFGSFDVQPGIAAFSHPIDGGYQVNVFVNLFASYRRGLRDFSSLELDFPEQLGGGIPWRGATPGGYR